MLEEATERTWAAVERARARGWKIREFVMNSQTRQQILTLESTKTAVGGAGPAGWSALRFLGLTTQLPAVPHVAVPGRQPALRNARVSKRSNALRVLLNPAEVAVLEVLRKDWIDRIDGGHEALIKALRRLTTDGQVRPASLDEVAGRETSLVCRRWASARVSL